MQATIISGAAAFACGALLLVLYHVLVVRRALRAAEGSLRAHDELLGTGDTTGTRRLSRLEERQNELAVRAERAEASLLELHALSRTDVSQIGFVRYDAFDDTGSELSYALALLNREGDGVVLTSIYSRADTRTYGKAVKAYQPVVHASAEEIDAINRARSTVSKV